MMIAVSVKATKESTMVAKKTMPRQWQGERLLVSTMAQTPASSVTEICNSIGATQAKSRLHAAAGEVHDKLLLDRGPPPFDSLLIVLCQFAKSSLGKIRASSA
jgi:hypothetical protein